MDVKDYAGIGGVLFAIYRHFFPKNPLKYDLSFVREKEIELTSEPFEIFSKLQFVYKEQPLVNVKLFEFSIRNTGNMDITAEMLREAIVIQFSDSYEILESKINNLSNNSKLRLNIESNMLSIHWDLLKPKEKVKICSLLYKKNLKTNSENRVKNFIETLDIKHRITGVERISKFLSSESITKKKTKSDYRTEAYMDLFIGVIFILLIPIIMHWVLDLFNDDRRIPYEWNTVDIIFTAVYIFLSLVHILVAIIAFDTAKKFK